jgi:hypothetical protein
MVEIEIGRLAGHQSRVGETGVGIGRCERGDTDGLLYGHPDTVSREVAGRCTALAPVSVDRDAESSILLPLDRFELAHPDGNAETLIVTRTGFSLIHARRARERHSTNSQLTELISNLRNVQCDLPSG